MGSLLSVSDVVFLTFLTGSDLRRADERTCVVFVLESGRGCCSV